jgi:predicted RNA polymerase sigma factor
VQEAANEAPLAGRTPTVKYMILTFVGLNHAVAVSMVAGPRAGLELIRRLEPDARINADRRFHAVRAHLFEMAGDRSAALEAYQAAAQAATNLQQQRYLNQQITRLRPATG